MKKILFLPMVITVFFTLTASADERKAIFDNLNASPVNGRYSNRHPNFPDPGQFDNCSFIATDSSGKALGKIIENKCSHLYVDIDDKGKETWGGEAMFLTNIHCEYDGYEFVFEDVMCSSKTVGLKPGEVAAMTVPTISNSYATNCLDEDYRLLTISDENTFDEGNKDRVRYFRRGLIGNDAAQ